MEQTHKINQAKHSAQHVINDAPLHRCEWPLKFAVMLFGKKSSTSQETLWPQANLDG